MSKRSGSGRHRRHRHITVPSVVGSVAMAAAASGALAMPQASGSSSDQKTLDAVPQRPMTTVSNGSALDTVSDAGKSLTSEATQTAERAHSGIVEKQRIEAAKRAARAEREAKRWVTPLTASYRVSAGFGSNGRLWSGTHTGVDLAASYGADVRALSSGEIIFAGWDGAYGYKVAIRHWDGTVSWYAHLSRIINASGTVEPGTVIGRVGSTGNSTGAHLHLEIRPGNGDPINPVPWLTENGIGL